MWEDVVLLDLKPSFDSASPTLKYISVILQSSLKAIINDFRVPGFNTWDSWIYKMPVNSVFQIQLTCRYSRLDNVIKIQK